MMDMQSLLCGIATDRFRNVNLRPNIQLPKLGRIPDLSKLARRRRPNVGGHGGMHGNHRRIAGRPGAAGATAAAGAAGAVRRRHLPVGSGEFTVGCIDLMSDHTTSGIFMRLYYPTDAKDIFKKEAQWPLWLPRKQYGHGYVYFRRKNKMFGTLLNWIGGDVYVPVLWQAPVLEDSGPLPVIIFTHGLGGNRTTYTTLCMDLASHGFVVAALEHRDGSASMTYCFRKPVNNNNVGETEPEMSPKEECTSDEEDEEEEEEWEDEESSCSNDAQECRGRPDYSQVRQQLEEHWLRYERQEKEDDYHVRNKQIHHRVAELERTLDLLKELHTGQQVQNVLGLQFDLQQFKGKLDLDRVAIVGHSFGGATTLAALALLPQIRCGVALDTWMLPLEDALYEQFNKPVLMVNTETFQWKSNVKDMFRLKVNQITHQDRVLITIMGTCHQSMSDFQFLVPSHFGKLLEMRNTLSPKVAMAINSASTRGFLNKFLDIPDGDHHEDILTARHPHVILGTNLDLQSTTKP